MQPGNSVNEKHDCAIVIIGGGPCGLMLAIELGRRGISVILLEERTSHARFPAANATQARTMEHYRRLGFAEKVRAEGLPPDYPTDIAYFTPQQLIAARMANQEPQFVVEVISNNDQINKANEKLVDYRNAKVQVVWFVYPKTKEVHVYRGKQITICTGEDICSAAPVIPGFLIAASEVFK